MKKIWSVIKNGASVHVVAAFALAILLLATAVVVGYSLTTCPSSEEPFRLLMTMIYNLGAYILIHMGVIDFKRNLASRKGES